MSLPFGWFMVEIFSLQLHSWGAMSLSGQGLILAQIDRMLKIGALAGSILAMIGPLNTNDDDGPQVFIWRSLRVWVGSIEEIPEAVLDRSTLALILVQGRCGPYRSSCQIFKVHVEGNEQLVVDEERLKMEGVLHNVEWRTSFIFSWLRGSRM